MRVRHGRSESADGISSAEEIVNVPESIALGMLLRTARERRGLTLQRIAHETKIPQRYLEALEHGHLEVLPGGTYRRGEVIAYADVAGVDRSVALAQLARAVERPAPQNPAPSAQGRQQPRRTIAGRVPWRLVAVAVIGVMMLVTLLRSRDAAPSFPVAPVMPAAAPVTAPPPSASGALPDTRSPLSVTNPESSTPPPVLADPPAPSAPPVVVPDARPLGPVADSSLRVITEPAGARVTIDGIGWGTAPLTVTHLPPGPKRIRATYAGYHAVERTVQTREGDRASIRIVLREMSPPTR